MTYAILSGVRVIESSAFVAAPLCGLTLAQYGADVIRFDLIGGGIDYGRLPVKPGGRSIYWTSLNKGKRSIAIDIRKPEGRELLQALVTAPDPEGGILLTNVPTAFLGHDHLAARRPDLISCTIEGNHDGSTAIDYTVNCATGYPMITGAGSREAPVNHALPAWDVACAYQAAFGLVAAILARRQTGQGQAMRIALSDVAIGVMSHLGVTTEAALEMPERTSIGNDIYGAFGRDFVTADGQRVMVAAVSAKQWQVLVAVCGLTAEVADLERLHNVDFSREADRFAQRELISGIVAPWIAARNLAEVGQAFDKGGVCWGPFQSTKELVEKDARASLANPMFSKIFTEGVGEHLAAGPAIRIEGGRRRETSAAPLLGQHTDEILARTLGLSDAAIGRLHDLRIVAGPESDPLAPAGAAPTDERGSRNDRPTNARSTAKIYTH